MVKEVNFTVHVCTTVKNLFVFFFFFQEEKERHRETESKKRIRHMTRGRHCAHRAGGIYSHAARGSQGTPGVPGSWGAGRGHEHPRFIKAFGGSRTPLTP